MSIANPQTYAEWYWSNQVDATKTFADEEETMLAPLLQSLLTMVTDLEGFPPAIAAMFQAVGQPGHFGLSSIAKEALGDAGKGSLSSGLSPFLRALGYAANKKFPSALIDFPTAVTLGHRGKIIPELFASRAVMNGYTESEARLLYDVGAPWPDMLSIIQWARYTSDNTETFARAQSKMDVSDDDFSMWEFLSQIKLSANDIQALLTRGYMNKQDATGELLRQGYRQLDADAVTDLAYAIPNPTILIQDALLKGAGYETIGDAVAKGGIHPDYVQAYVNAVLSKPNAQDLIRWRLRSDPNLGELEQDLRKLGIHPDYIPVFRALAYPVPPVGDMITMAVREAFTPDIAARFGQYDDYPQDLTRFAAMNGIDEEWAKRYWAAHWSLPSPQQGFEMLHRGIITRDELQLLMRALDIMPFWREKLVQAAYNPLTRVDIRRMYALGVVSEGEVERAYLDIGYNEENARRLRAFVVRDTIKSQSGMSVSKIITAYKNGYANRQDAYNAIASLGVMPGNISDILESADRQAQWQNVKDAITAIGNQYKQELYDEQQTRSALQALGLPTNKIGNLMAKWEKDGKKEHGELWTKADTIALMKKSIITQARALQELKAIGYNAEHANAIIALAQPTAK
jgi:hypothetical protein